MDPSIRRDIWNLILRKKQNRVTVMTTHSMEEADILGDNIAIMAGGQLRSVITNYSGSPPIIDGASVNSKQLVIYRYYQCPDYGVLFSSRPFFHSQSHGYISQFKEQICWSVENSLVEIGLYTCTSGCLGYNIELVVHNENKEVLQQLVTDKLKG